MSDTDFSLSSRRETLVSQQHGGWRLDHFLAVTLADFSRSRLQHFLQAGWVTLGAKTIKDANHRVKPGDVYVVTVPPVSSATPKAENIPLNVIYEDRELIVIDKPAGLVVHPAAGNLEGTLVNALIAHCGPGMLSIGGEARPGIVHRLDKDTSGLLVAAKTERAMASLAKQFANHTITRAYNAIVWGRPREVSGVIEGQIGRNPFDRKRMAVLRTSGKFASTGYKVTETFGVPERPYASLLECRLKTGRTHQIRVHLAHLGHPLVGDRQYGRSRTSARARTQAQTEAFSKTAQFSRQALHAFLLGFQHPTLHKTLHFRSPWPADFAELVTALRGLNRP